MALSQTPSLNEAINAALKTYHNTMWSGTGITENNFASDPATREAKARNQLADDITNAITDFIVNTIFQVVPGSLHTLGGPAAQSNIDVGNIIKI